MGTPPSSLADEATAANELAATADDEAMRAAAAAAEAAVLEAKRRVAAALAQQKESLTKAYHLFELKFVACRGAEAMHTFPGPIAAKVAMVDEAKRFTDLDETEYDMFAPDNLPTLEVATQERNDAQVALRDLLVAYNSSLEAAGSTDGDTGKFVRALSLPLLSSAHAVEESVERESGAGRRDDTDDNDETTPTAAASNEGTTMTMSPSLLNLSAPLLSARPPSPGSAPERDRGRVPGAGVGGGVADTSTSKEDKHTSAGDASNAVRRSPRCSVRRGAAAVMGKTVEKEGDRGVELESESESDSDGSAGSN